MSYQPKFTITPALLARVEQIAAVRERILAATVQVAWIPALQKDTRTRNTHSSTAIEGNPLTLEEVRAMEEGRELPAAAPRAKREVLNYFAGLRFVEKHAKKHPLTHEEILSLHRIIAGEVMDQGAAGRYRTIHVRVGHYMPPPPEEVSGLMFELLAWWNKESEKLVLRPKQEQLLQFLRDRKSMSPKEIWDAVGVSRQGAIKPIQPLMDAGLVKRVGTRKSGRYLLT